MATVLPEFLEANHETETFLYEWAKNHLPKEWVCYFNYQINTQECDWIIFIPGYGAATIEIKGWSASRILSVKDQNSILYKTQKSIEQFYSPYKQARRYSHALIQKLKEEIEENVLVVSSFCLPKITSDEFRKKDMQVIAAEKHVFLQEDLNNPPLFKKKLIDLFKEQGAITSSTTSFSDRLMLKARKIFEANFEINSLISQKPFYSVLLFSNAHDSKTTNEFSELIKLWQEGKKIIFVTNADLESYQQILHQYIQKSGLDQYEDFQLWDEKKEKWKPSVFNFYFYSIEVQEQNSFLIHDGNLTELKEQEDFLQKLHEEGYFNIDQYQVEHAPINKNLIIKAGAGSGKTFSMVSRIQYLIHKHGYSAQDLQEKVYLITFTNEAANNMKSRLQKSLQNYYLLTRNPSFFEMIEQVHNFHISTIHSLIKRILQKFSLHLGLGKDLKIASAVVERNKFLDESLNQFMESEFNHDTELMNDLRINMYYLKKRLKEFFNQIENQNIDLLRNPPDFGKNERNKVFDDLIPKVLEETERKTRDILDENNSVRLKDLMIKIQELLETATEDLAAYRGKIDYVFVDEFQDTDNTQIDLINQFQEILHFSLFVVGDVKQCIYRFRGAEEKAFDRLLGETKEEEWGDAYSFNKNYRTDQSLLSRFESSFQKWGEKELLAYDSVEDQLFSPILLNKKEELFLEPVKLETEDAFDEKFITKLNEKKMNLPDGEQIAILVRSNYQIEYIRTLCLQHNLYVETDKGGDLFKIDPILDLYKLVLALKNPKNPEHIANLYTTSYVKDSLDKSAVANLAGDTRSLIQYFTEHPPLSKWDYYSEELRRKPILSVLWELRLDTKPWLRYQAQSNLEREDKVRLRAFYKRNLDLIFEQFIGLGDTDYLTLNKIEQYLKIMIVTKQESENRQVFQDDQKSTIICTTVHKAKGLEFHTVFLPFTDKEMEKETSYSEVDLIILNDHEIGYRFKLQDEEALKNPYGQNSYTSNHYYDRELVEESRQKSKEEARILYVAMTRAIKEFVYFAKPDKRNSKMNWKKLIEMGEQP